MKKIVITGGLGYVGSALTRKLIQNSSFDISVIDNAFNPTETKFLVSKGVKCFEFDIFNCKEILDGCDICYHLAGITNVPQTVAQSTPEKDAEIHKYGTEGTRYIIEHMPKTGKLIFASTQVVFDGLKEEVHDLDENSLTSPSVAYSISKRRSEIDLSNSDIPYTILRFASVYGYAPNMRWKILPNLFSKMAAQNKNLTVFGGQNYKPLISVNDLGNILYLTILKEFDGQIYHAVSSNARVIEIANVCKEINPIIDVIETKDETPNKGFTLSNAKLKAAMDLHGLRFEDTLQTEIEKMIAYWKNKP